MTAKKAGLDVQKILEDPDIVARDPRVGAIMSAGFIKNVLDTGWRRRNMESQFGFDAMNPTSLQQGIYLMAAIAGGGGFKSMLVSTWFKRAVRNATAKAKAHIRIIGDEPLAVSENQDVD